MLGAHYAPHGALTSATFGNDSGNAGGVLANGFNNRLQPATIRATFSATPLIDLSYSYTYGGVANNGNVMQIVNNRSSARTQTFTYDRLNRVASAQTPALWGDAFGYDAWGNLLSKTVTVGTAETLSVTVDAKNHIVGDTYDAAGNLLTDGVNTYTYDAENRLKTVAGVTYTYDGDSLRVAKSNGRLYWRGMGIGPLTVTDATGALIHEFVYLNGRRVGFINSVGNRYYFWSDHLGSATVVTNAQGQIKEESDYYPFGGERVITDTLDNRFKFTGQEFDPETANYGFPFRFQSTRLGRFLSPDPVEGDPANPQSWNRYAYVLNNPSNLTDPLGLCPRGFEFMDGGCGPGGGSGGGCMMEGIEVGCGLVNSALSSGAAFRCPNDDCRGNGTQWKLTEVGDHLLRLVSSSTAYGGLDSNGVFHFGFRGTWVDLGPVWIWNSRTTTLAVVYPPGMNGALQAAKQLAKGMPKPSSPPTVTPGKWRPPQTIEDLLGEASKAIKYVLDNLDFSGGTGLTIPAMVNPCILNPAALPNCRQKLGLGTDTNNLY